jgi:hypothetical protein
VKALRALMTLSAVVVAASIGGGCSSSTDGAATGDEQDATQACKVFFVKENRFLTADELKKLGDPIAQKVLQGGKGCPTKLSEIVAKLNTTDTKNCIGGGGGSSSGGNGGIVPPLPKPDAGAASGAPTGLTTRFVSDASQELGKPDTYRGVLTRECDGRTGHELFISMFGIAAGGPLPDDVELIGEDKTKGVFDFYAREEGKWKFFGNSLNLVEDGYDCDANGACVPKAATKTRCASCHVGGGLVMKELNSPWVKWEGDTQTPGVDDLMKAHADILGGRGDGIDMENRVTSGNHDDWIPARIEFLKTKGTQEVLRPLFCTIDLNLQSGQGSANADFFLDPIWSQFSGVQLTDYDTAIASNKQVLLSSQTGKPLAKTGGGNLTDTFFKFTYPERSKQDVDYVQALIDKKVIDADFAKDVAFVDFTRPIFSKTRCDLLAAAPTLDAAKMTPDAIRDGFKKNLAGKTGAAADLLKSLGDTKDDAAHTTAVSAFLTACGARPGKDMTSDILAYASHIRTAMRNVHSKREGQGGQGIIEFEESLPRDSITDIGAKGFDPATCTLK